MQWPRSQGGLGSGRSWAVNHKCAKEQGTQFLHKPPPSTTSYSSKESMFSVRRPGAKCRYILGIGVHFRAPVSMAGVSAAHTQSPGGTDPGPWANGKPGHSETA